MTFNLKIHCNTPADVFFGVSVPVTSQTFNLKMHGIDSVPHESMSSTVGEWYTRYQQPLLSIVCRSVLQHVAANCVIQHRLRVVYTPPPATATNSVSQRVAASCSELQRVKANCVIQHSMRVVYTPPPATGNNRVLQCVTVRCRVAVCCSVLQRVAACCSELR